MSMSVGMGGTWNATNCRKFGFRMLLFFIFLLILGSFVVFPGSSV
jgi:hypothetical protein